MMEIKAAVRDDVSVIAGFIREQEGRENTHTINEEGMVHIATNLPPTMTC